MSKVHADEFDDETEGYDQDDRERALAAELLNQGQPGDDWSGHWVISDEELAERAEIDSQDRAHAEFDRWVEGQAAREAEAEWHGRPGGLERFGLSSEDGRPEADGCDGREDD